MIFETINQKSVPMFKKLSSFFCIRLAIINVKSQGSTNLNEIYLENHSIRRELYVNPHSNTSERLFT